MSLQKILNMASFRAGLLTQDWQSNLKKGMVKETIKYLGLNIFENPGMPEKSFLDALSLTIRDKWVKEYGIVIALEDISNAIHETKVRS